MHSLIIGQTNHGKTLLAKRLANQYRAQGVGVLLFDPIEDPDWVADYRSANEQAFLKTVWASRRCAVFVDEAGDVAGNGARDFVQLATRGRHWGHRCYFLAQRGMMVARTIRDQCSEMLAFATGPKDAAEWSEEWNCDLSRLSTLPRGQYVRVIRGQGVQVGGTVF